MSRSGEMKEKFDKIRELQDQRDRQERRARDQADELDAILEASRKAHGEGVPLVSASRLSGPGFGGGTRRPVATTNPEDAYTSNFAKSRFASPEAFSRNRNQPTSSPDGSIAGMVQRTVASTTAVAQQSLGAPTAPIEPGTQGRVAVRNVPDGAPESTVTMTVKAFASDGPEITQVVRRRAAQTPTKPRREPPAVPPPNLASPAIADGPAITLPPQATVPTAGVTPRAAPQEDTPIAPQSPVVQRVVFVPPPPTPAKARMVTSRPANYGALPPVASTTMSSDDTRPTDPQRVMHTHSDEITARTAPREDTAPGRETTTPGTEPTPPFGALVPAEYDTSPGMGTVAPLERTSPGVIEVTPRPDTAPNAAIPPPTPEENTDHDIRYKRVKEIDALIARFAADVEVKVGQGRENTFLRKRSEIVPGEEDALDEHTQPRHRNIEVRRENTEIIPRRLPPRKRK